MRQPAQADGVANLLQQPRREAEVVLGHERDSEHLVSLEQVPQIGPAEAGTGVAVTAFFERTVLDRPRRAGQVEPEARQSTMKDMAVTRDARRHRAVEGVDAAERTLDQVVGLADPEPVPRPAG